MNNYYTDNLNSHKLLQVYETSIPRVRQYLEAEIDFVKNSLEGTENVLELGAGYGRILRDLAPHCSSIVGIDISAENVGLGQAYLNDCPNTRMIVMDVHQIAFEQPFDTVLCLQNGLSAMRADTQTIDEILRLLSPGGKAYFSSYSANFWDYRLAWFQEQAAKGLLGEIDMEQTKDGVIVCKDGFKATTHSPHALKEIGEASGYPYELKEIDESSIFLIINKPNRRT